MNTIETCSTIYHTPSGDIEIPDKIRATAKSRVAPLWLIFPTHIINTQHIVEMKLRDHILCISTIKNQFDIEVTDLEKTWKALQNVFANGVID